MVIQNTSSPLFALSAGYLHYLNWRAAFEQILEFRRQLKREMGLPVKLEFHAKYFLLNKNPYRPFGFPDAERIAVMSAFCDLIASPRAKVRQCRHRQAKDSDVRVPRS